MPFTVKLMRNPIGVEFEVGSVPEALGILQDNKDKFLELLAFAGELGGNGDDAVTTTLTPTGGETAAEPAGSKPGRKKKNQPDATTATAPAPLPVPGAAAPPAPPVPVDTTAGDNGIPKFLDRTAPAAAAPPPPPLLPTAPPVAPAAAPAFILGNKIADDLQKRLDGSADKGDALRAWLMPHVTAFVALPTATIDEVIAVIRFTEDVKVAHLATPLGIS